MIDTSTFLLTEDKVRSGVYIPELRSTKNKFFAEIEVLQYFTDIDSWGRCMIPSKMGHHANDETFSLAAVKGNTGRWGIIDLERMQMLTPCKFSRVDLWQALRQHLAYDDVQFIPVTIQERGLYFLSITDNSERKPKIRTYGPIDTRTIVKGYSLSFEMTTNPYSDFPIYYLLIESKRERKSLVSLPKCGRIGGAKAVWKDIKQIQGELFAVQAPDSGGLWGVIDARENKLVVPYEHREPLTAEMIREYEA